jgi:hypothetical protein
VNSKTDVIVIQSSGLELTMQIHGISISSPIEARIFAEYGAIFFTTASPPPVIIFSSEEQVRAFQSSLSVGRAMLGDYEIELQSEAMQALVASVAEAERRGLRISAHAADAGRRSYQDTVRLWNRNVNRGLDHWVDVGRLAPERAQMLRQLAPPDQLPIILELEEREHIYFGTGFNKPVLHSVAAPGASQHLSMLAFDLAQYQDETIERILALHGWHRTVVDDLPHFTFLGRAEEALPDLGLKQVTLDYPDRSYRFWVPDI